jgi:hypothetical protein
MRNEELRRGPFFVAALIALAAAGVSVAAIPIVNSGRQPKITALRAKGDAHVSAATPTENFGGFRRLTVDGKPVTRAYVRFLVPEEIDVKRINLLAYTHTQSRLGYRVRLATRRWNEQRITWANAPRASSVFVLSGPLQARRWKAVDVTALVGSAEGYIGFVLTTVATRAITLSSRESGLTGPRLVIEHQDTETRPPTTQPPPPPTP